MHPMVMEQRRRWPMGARLRSANKFAAKILVVCSVMGLLFDSIRFAELGRWVVMDWL